MKNLSSKNNTILLVSDSHQDVARFRTILKNENYDYIVHLGDFFDSPFGESEKDVENTCNFLKEWIFKPNFITTWGNHDLNSFFGDQNRFAYCSGSSEDKRKFITEILGDARQKVIDKFEWVLWVDNYLCSHAGLHPSFLLPHQKLGKKSLSHWLQQQIEQADIALKSEQNHWVFGAGRARGGWQNKGGLTWQDFRYEFKPIAGLNQIFGHTHCGHITNQGKNLCIDCGLNEYMVIYNGKVTIKKYADL